MPRRRLTRDAERRLRGGVVACACAAACGGGSPVRQPYRRKRPCEQEGWEQERDAKLEAWEALRRRHRYVGARGCALLPQAGGHHRRLQNGAKTVEAILTGVRTTRIAAC